MAGEACGGCATLASGIPHPPPPCPALDHHSPTCHAMYAAATRPARRTSPAGWRRRHCVAKGPDATKSLAGRARAPAASGPPGWGRERADGAPQRGDRAAPPAPISEGGVGIARRRRLRRREASGRCKQGGEGRGGQGVCVSGGGRFDLVGQVQGGRECPSFVGGMRVRVTGFWRCWEVGPLGVFWWWRGCGDVPSHPD